MIIFTGDSEGDRLEPLHQHVIFGVGTSAVSNGPDGLHTHTIRLGEEFTSEDSGHIHRAIPKESIMYDGGSVDDEVKQNVYDQQHPPLMTSELPVTQKLEIVRDDVVEEEDILAPIPGLSTRQIELIHNIDNGQPEQGAARERRLELVNRDISEIRRFLPRLEEVRAFLDTMPVDNDEDLEEAKKLVDGKIRSFIRQTTSKLASLQLELDIKQPA